MRDQKKIIIISIVFLLFIIIFYLFNTDRYIRDNIKNIDSANNIELIKDEEILSCELTGGIMELFTYGGRIIKVDNLIEKIFTPYANELTELDLIINYMEDNSLLNTANIYRSNENSEEYILHMNNVYWSTDSKIEEILELFENKVN